MFKFKVKYTDSRGNPVEVEIEVSTPTLTAGVAANKIGVSPSNILKIRKV